MKRRGNGEGSIYRRSDGKWCATLAIGYDQNGKRKRRYLYGRTKAEVLDKLGGLQSDARAGTLAEPSRVTVGDYCRDYVENVARQRVRATTLANYRRLVRLHISPHIGG